MTRLKETMEKLSTCAHPENLAGMKRYGLTINNRLGVSIPELRRIAKEIGQDHNLALALWGTGIDDARILASMVDTPQTLTDAQMDAWVQDFYSWDVCDQVCDNLFEKSPLAWKKVHDWAKREEEFVKRAAFALIACLAWHNRDATDEQFIMLLPVIQAGADDDRNFVKKAVNWALRNIGKRNLVLNVAAIRCAREIQLMNTRSARWIAGDALRELQGAKVQHRLQVKLKPKSISGEFHEH